jgi:Flp pilus assembly protein TadG
VPEFAIAIPAVLLLVMGLFDAGRAVINYTTLTNAARAGARVAIVDQSNGTVCSLQRTFKCAASDQAVAMGIVPEAIPDLVVTGSHCMLTGDCTVTVTVSHDMEMITPLVANVIGPFTISASATMPIERTYATP